MISSFAKARAHPDTTLEQRALAEKFQSFLQD
jgi:hypothetical protein